MLNKYSLMGAILVPTSFVLGFQGCSSKGDGLGSDNVDAGEYTKPPLVYCDNHGEPCDDNDPCTVDPTCVGGMCFGQMPACVEGEECPDNECPFYYFSTNRETLTIHDDEVGEYRVMKSEIIVNLKEGEGRREAIRLADMTNSRIVGQLPLYGMYLFKTEASDVFDMEEIMEKLSPEDSVLYSAFNGVMESTGECNVISNNYWLHGTKKCPWLDTNYFQGLLMFTDVYRPFSEIEGLRDQTKGPVRVAIIEKETSVKNNIKKSNRFYLSHPSLAHLKEPGRSAFIGETDIEAETKPEDSHATSVLGMLAAKKEYGDGNCPSGILTDFLEDQYVVFLGYSDSKFGHL